MAGFWSKTNRKWPVMHPLSDMDIEETISGSSIIQRGGHGKWPDPFWNPYPLSLPITFAVSCSLTLLPGSFTGPEVVLLVLLKPTTAQTDQRMAGLYFESTQRKRDTNLANLMSTKCHGYNKKLLFPCVLLKRRFKL